MRTLELLRALNDRETAEMDKIILAEKRKTLHVLYKELKKYRKLGGTPANEELFQTIYNKEYTSDKSYLLRNELRLLNEIFYEFLIDKTFKEYIKKHKSTYNYWLSRSLFDRKINNAFAAEIDRFIDHAQTYIKADDSALLMGLKSLWMIYNLPKNAGNVNQQKNALDNWRKEQIRAWRYQLRETEARQAYLDNTLASITGDEKVRTTQGPTPPQIILDLSEGAQKDIMEEYLILKKHAYQTRGKDRINILKQMLVIEKSDSYASEYSAISSQLASLNSLAMESILLGEFNEAELYLQEILSICSINQLPVLPAVMQNYVCNKLNTGEYGKGIEFYTLNEDTIKKSRQYIATAIGKVYCHLFLGQPDEALESLPQNIQPTEHQHLTIRMVYLIVFILRGQHDLALNECTNIARMIRANEGGYFQSYAWIINLFLRYLNANNLERQNRKLEIEKIKTEITDDSGATKQLLITEFSLQWLLKQL